MGMRTRRTRTLGYSDRRLSTIACIPHLVSGTSMRYAFNCLQESHIAAALAYIGAPREVAMVCKGGRLSRQHNMS